MVKIPNFDELKKMGNDMVDKVKSHIENVGQTINKPEDVTVAAAEGESPIRHQFRVLYSAVNELKALEAKQADLTRKVETQLATLAAMLEKPKEEKKKP